MNPGSRHPTVLAGAPAEQNDILFKINFCKLMQRIKWHSSSVCQSEADVFHTELLILHPLYPLSNQVSNRCIICYTIGEQMICIKCYIYGKRMLVLDHNVKEENKYPPHKLLRSKVKVPAGDRVCCPPCGPHSTKGSASLISYPLVHVTVIWASILNCHFYDLPKWSLFKLLVMLQNTLYSAWNIFSTFSLHIKLQWKKQTYFIPRLSLC